MVKKKGACVFDIDQTLTCKRKCSLQKIEKMKEAIESCNENNFEVVINTARPPQPFILHSIHPSIQKLLKHAKVYTRKLSCENTVPEEKFQNMKKISKHFNVPLHKTILVDDLLETCRHINRMGGHAIHVKNEDGIDANEVKQIHKFINQN